MAALRMAHRVLGMGRKRRVPGLPASGKGAAPAVAAVVATAMAFSLADVQTASAQVYVNDGTDSNCSLVQDRGSAAAPADRTSGNSNCNANAATQTTHSQFNGPPGTAGNNAGSASSLSVGRQLYVNAGQIGVTDVLNQTFSMRMGSLATMNATAGANAIAIGSAQTNNATGTSSAATQALGANAIAIGSSATANQAGAIAFGLGAQTSSANSVALGANSVTTAAAATENIVINGATYAFAGATPSSTVSIGATGNERTLTNLAAGRLSAASTDAVNGSQLFAATQAVETVGTALTSALGGGSGFDPVTGDFIAPSYSVGGDTFNDVGAAFARTDTILGNQGTSLETALGGGAGYNEATGELTGPTYMVGDGMGGTTTVSGVGGAITNLDDRTTTNETAIADLTSGTVGLVRQAGPTADVTVAEETGGTVVDFTGTAGERVLTGVAAGDVSATSTDAINGSQLFTTNQGLSATAAALGGNAEYDPATGAFTAPSYDIGGDTFNDVGAAFARTDTILGNQGASLETALGGGASYDEATGELTGPTYTVGDGMGGTTTVTGVGGAITNLDDRTTINETAIGDLSDAVNSGSVGLVRQAGPTADVTVAAETGGTVVDVAGTAGNRRISGVAAGTAPDDAVNVNQFQGGLSALQNNINDLGQSAVLYDRDVNDSDIIDYNSVTLGGSYGQNPVRLRNVADGEVSATSTDAVNGSQLFALSGGVADLGDSLASAFGGSSAFDSASNTLTPGFNVGGMDYSSVQDALNAVGGVAGAGFFLTANGEVATNINPGDTLQLFDGQNIEITNADGVVTIATAADLTADSLTLSTGQVFDASGLDMNGTGITGLAAGTIGAGSTDAVTGGQAFDMAQSVADSLGGGAAVNADGTISAPTYTIGGNTVNSLGDAFNAVDGNLTAMNDTLDQITANVAVGNASGTDAVASGTGSIASGDDSVAVGPGANASGDGAVALGHDSVASGTGSLALGEGASATEDNSIALGAGSTTDTIVGTASTTIGGTTYGFAGGTPVGTVSVGSAGAERTITNVAAGQISAGSTDAVNGSQLHATNQAIESLGTGIGDFTDYGVQYDRNPDGSRANSLTLAGGDPNAPVVLANVATGTADHHAANVGQVNAGLQTTLDTARSYTDSQVGQLVGTANAYTDQVAADTLSQANDYADQRLGQLTGDLSGIRSEARQAAAIGLAAASLRFDDRPGKLSVAVGGGAWRGEGALALGAGFTSENENFRSNITATTSGGHWGVGAGLSFTLN